MHALVCGSIFLSKWTSVCFVLPRWHMHPSVEWTLSSWRSEGMQFAIEGTVEGSLISHGSQDAQHKLRGRGCTLVEMRCSTTFFFSPVVHAKVFCRPQWWSSIWGCTFIDTAYYMSVHLVIFAVQRRWRVLMSALQSMRRSFFSPCVGSWWKHRFQWCKEKVGAHWLTENSPQQLQPTGRDKGEGNYCENKYVSIGKKNNKILKCDIYQCSSWLVGLFFSSSDRLFPDGTDWWLQRKFCLRILVK